jgi:hypothetical protein
MWNLIQLATYDFLFWEGMFQYNASDLTPTFCLVLRVDGFGKKWQFYWWLLLGFSVLQSHYK